MQFLYICIIVLINLMQLVDALSVLVLTSRSIVLAWFFHVFRTAGQSILKVGRFFWTGPFSEGFSEGSAGIVFGRFLADLGSHLYPFSVHFGIISAPFFRSLISFLFLLILWLISVPLIVPKNDFNVILFAKIEKSQVSIC